MRRRPGARHRPWIALGVAAMLLAACAPLPLRPIDDTDDAVVEAVARAQPPVPSKTTLSPTQATPRQRAAIVERIWRTIEQRYYDPAFQGADVEALRARSRVDVATVANDAAFYRVLVRDVDAIGDSHTTVLTPRQADEERTDHATRIGIEYDLIEGRVVIDLVEPDSAAAEAGIREGMIVDAVDGIVLDEAFFAKAEADASLDPDGPARKTEPERETEARRLKAVRLLLVDGGEAPHRLALIRADDSRFDVDVRPRYGDFPGRTAYWTLPSRIGVLRITAFERRLGPAIAAHVERARERTRALIVDLRGNPGGDVNLFLWLVGRFVDRADVVADIVHRSTLDVRPERLVAEPADRPYDAPLAILVDASTASSAELTAHVLAEQRGAVIVGETTCGCVAGVRGDYLLPDGGALRVTELGFRSAGGRRMEADPLRPDVPVAITLADVRAGRDAALQAAEAALLARLSTAAAPAR